MRDITLSSQKYQVVHSNTLIEKCLHSQCMAYIEVSQAFVSWSNVGRLSFDQHLVK